MTRIFFIANFLILITTFTAFGKDDGSNAILGKWYNEEKTAIVEVYKCGNKFCGKIVWLKEPNEQGKPRVDKNNPDDKLKAKPLMGLNLLEGFTYDDGEWENGTIYDPKNGKTYSCTIKMGGKNKLNVRGYVGISLIGRTTVWTSAN